MPNLRAILIDPGAKPERPVQIFATSRQEIEDWAHSILPGASDGSVVKVYLTLEVITDLIPKTSKPLTIEAVTELIAKLGKPAPLK